MTVKKVFATQEIAEDFENIRPWLTEDDAVTCAIMEWNHLTDSEKLGRRIYVLEITVDLHNPEYTQDLLAMAELKAETGDYDNIVWDSWEFEHDSIASIIDYDLEKYMEQKNVVVRHSSGIECTAYNYIMQELEEMDAWADELTLYKEKDWVLDMMKEKVDAVADDEVEEKDKTYCLEHVEEVE